MLVAANELGSEAAVEHHDGDDPAVTVTLDGGDGPAPRDGAGETTGDDGPALADRRTVRGDYADRPVPPAALARLQSVAAAADVTLTFVADDRRADIADLQETADRRQMDDPDYWRELGRWVGTGAFGDAWLAARNGQVAVTYLDLGEREGARNARHVEAAPVVAVLSTAGDGVAARVRTAQVFERLSLAATRDDPSDTH